MNNVRWYIESISDTVQNCIFQSPTSEYVLSEPMEVECVDKNGKSLGVRTVIQITEGFKDSIYTNRRACGYVFNLFRSFGDNKPKLYFECLASKPPPFSKSGSVRARRGLKVTTASALLRQAQRRDAKARIH